MLKMKNTQQPQSSRTQLSSLIKSARDIMRKDAGLNGRLDTLATLLNGGIRQTDDGPCHGQKAAYFSIPFTLANKTEQERM